MRKTFAKYAFLAIRAPFALPVLAFILLCSIFSATFRIFADGIEDMAGAADDAFMAVSRKVEKVFSRFGNNR